MIKIKNIQKIKNDIDLKKYAKIIVQKYDSFKKYGGFINASVNDDGELDIYHRFSIKEYQSYPDCTFYDAQDRKIFTIKIDKYRLTQKEALDLLQEAVHVYQKVVKIKDKIR